MNYICTDRKTLQDRLEDASASFVPEGGKNIVNCDREDVLDGGLRAFARPTFDHTCELTVRFVGEDGIDSGGLTREFLRLAIRQLQQSSLFEGDINRRFLTLNDKGFYRNLRTCIFA